MENVEAVLQELVECESRKLRKKLVRKALQLLKGEDLDDSILVEEPLKSQKNKEPTGGDDAEEPKKKRKSSAYVEEGEAVVAVESKKKESRPRKSSAHVEEEEAVVAVESKKKESRPRKSSVQVEEEETDPKPPKKKDGKQRKSSVSIEDEQISLEVEKKSKKQKSSSKEEEVATTSKLSDDEEEEVVVKKAKKRTLSDAVETPKRTKLDEEEVVYGEEEVETPVFQEKQRFQRVNVEKSMMEAIITDNSYEAVFGGNGYGAKASEKLKTVKGKGFRHEKTKKKRGSYRGGAIDDEVVNSVSFDSE